MAAQRSARRPAGGNSDVYAHSEKMLRVHRKNHVHACTLRQTVDAYERECNRRLHRIQQEMHEILYYEQLPREREIARARLGGTHAARARDALPSVRYITRLPRLAKPQKSHSEDAETVTTSRRDGELDAPVTAIKNLRLQTERDAFLQKVLFGESRTSLDQTKNCDDVTDVKVKGSSDVTACEQHADEPTVQKTLDRDATMTSPGFKFLRNKIINDEFSDTSDVISSRGSPACHNGNGKPVPQRQCNSQVGIIVLNILKCLKYKIMVSYL